MNQLLVGCSGWNYPQSGEEGGWVGPFYPTSTTKMLSYYSHYFNTAEMDSIFYDKFYSKMTKGTFIGMAKAVPEGFQFSLKVPETITHVKKLDMAKGAMADFEHYLDKISPLKNTKKLGAILFQLAPSFTVDNFRQTESFLDHLPSGYEYAMEFRHPSWQTEGPWEMLRQYNIAAVMTDSPDPKLKFLSNAIVTADHSLIRLHGRNKGYWYNYLYTEQELQPWADKVQEIRNETKVLRTYFNNHPIGQSVANALQFKEMTGEKLTKEQAKAKENVLQYLENMKAVGKQTTLT